MNSKLMFRAVRALVVVALCGAWVTPTEASEPGMFAANQVSQASYYDFMDNWLYTHVGHNRGVNGPQHDPCRDNIAALFQSYGLTVTLEPVVYSGSTYYNVVGTKWGMAQPTQEYIIGAHYDSVNNPGADDNASGVALVLECARVLSQYDSASTIRFIAFTREEQGLYGSNAYVSQHLGDDIRAMISADMVAYTTGAHQARIYQRAGSPVATALAAAITEYGDGLGWTNAGWISASDHAPFDSAGYDACLLIEDEVWSNPWYHTQQDSFEQPGNLNFPFAVKMTRSVCGYLVDAAGVLVNADYLAFELPEPLPEYSSPAGTTVVQVEVVAHGNAVPLAGSGLLHYDVGLGWQTAPVVEVTPNVYDAYLPSAACGSEVRFYFSAQEVGGAVFTAPFNAPASYYTTTAAYGADLVFHDDFQTNTGWTAVNLGASSGDWQRGVPVNDPNWDYAPIADSDGSGQCYLTQNTTGNSDVDGGAVALYSPVLDMSAGHITIEYDYYLRLTNTTGGVDRLLVEISSNGGSGPWIEIARHITDGGRSWRKHTITQAELNALGVVLTSQMQLCFTTNDADPQSINESGLDAFRVIALRCTPLFCAGDADCDGTINWRDIDFFVAAMNDNVAAWQAMFAPGTPACDFANNDVDGDGTVNWRDIDPLVAVMNTVCP